MKAGNANCDTLTGTHALNAALIGLIQARKTGEGCRVDIGMMDTVMISCGETVVDYGKELIHSQDSVIMTASPHHTEFSRQETAGQLSLQTARNAGQRCVMH